MLCPSCAERISDTAKVCGHCGTRLRAAPPKSGLDPTSPQPAVPPPTPDPGPNPSLRERDPPTPQVQRPAPQLSPPAATKRCPYCAETIQAAATLCKHCRTPLGPDQAPQQSLPPRQPRKKRKWIVATFAVVAVGAAVTLAVIALQSDDAPVAEAPAATTAAVSETTPPPAETTPATVAPTSEAPGEPADGATIEAAAAAFESGNDEQTIAIANEVLTVQPDAAAAHELIGLAEERRGNMEAAITAFTAALASDPANTAYRDQLGNAVLATVPEAAQVSGPHQVGRWPKQIGATTQAIWVANSGSATVSQLNRTTLEPEGTVSTGRLPVDIEVTSPEDVWVLVRTDRELLHIAPSTGIATTVANLPDCPAGMTVGPSGSLFVLLAVDCGSSDSSVVVFSPGSGTLTDPVRIGFRDVRAIEYAGDKLWLTSAGGGLLMLNPDTFEFERQLLDGEFARAVTAHDDYLFVDVGVLSGDSVTETVIHRVALDDLSAVPLATLDARAVKVTATDHLVIAVGYDGSLSYVASAVPGYVSTSALPVSAIQVGEVEIVDDRLLVTYYEADSEGWLLAIDMVD